MISLWKLSCRESMRQVYRRSIKLFATLYKLLQNLSLFLRQILRSSFNTDFLKYIWEIYFGTFTVSRISSLFLWNFFRKVLSSLFSPNIGKIPKENFRNTGKLKRKFLKYKTAKGYLSNVGKIWNKFSDRETKIRGKLVTKLRKIWKNQIL